MSYRATDKVIRYQRERLPQILNERNKSQKQRQESSAARSRQWADPEYAARMRSILVARNKSRKQRLAAKRRWTKEARMQWSAEMKRQMRPGTDRRKNVSRAASNRMNRLWKTDQWKQKIIGLVSGGRMDLRVFAKRLRAKQSKEQIELRRIVKEITTRRVYSERAIPEAKTIVDLYIPSLRLCIFYDSAYWHKDTAAVDKAKTAKLNELGFRVVRVRENRYRSDLSGLFAMIGHLDAI